MIYDETRIQLYDGQCSLASKRTYEIIWWSIRVRSVHHERWAAYLHNILVFWRNLKSSGVSPSFKFAFHVPNLIDLTDDGRSYKTDKTLTTRFNPTRHLHFETLVGKTGQTRSEMTELGTNLAWPTPGESARPYCLRGRGGGRGSHTLKTSNICPWLYFCQFSIAVILRSSFYTTTWRRPYVHFRME